jgi:hypothetical protein
MTTETNTTQRRSRREFLRGASFGVSIPIAGDILAACNPTAQTQHGELPEAPATQDHQMSADEMDAMHEAGIKAFMAGVQTEGLANQPLEPKIDSKFKVFDLTCAVTPWECTPGQKVDA